MGFLIARSNFSSLTVRVIFLFTSFLTGSLEIFASSPDERAVALFRHVISVPTVRGRGRVPEVAQFLADKFIQAGIPRDDVKVMPYLGADRGAGAGGDDKTAALIVRWRAAKPTRRPVMLMGHMDVVEALSEDWGGKDPFVLREEGGYFYGRGASDMKDGVVAITSAILKLKEEGFSSSRDIIVFFTGDEETGGRGALLGSTEWWPLIESEYGLNADGGGAQADREGKVKFFGFQSEEKTYADYEVRAVNRGGHSSKPRPDNAIYELSRALLGIERYRFTARFTEATRGYFEYRATQTSGDLQAAIRAWLKDPNDRKAADRVEADPVELGMTRTRCVATRIAGGHADNALPQLAKATINCRIIPGETPDGTLGELRKAVEGTGVSVERLTKMEASVLLPINKEVWEAFRSVVQEKYPGTPAIAEMSTGASDARPFRIKGIPVFGTNGAWLVNPDDLRHHGKDERIPVKSFYSNLDHWVQLIKKVCQSPVK